MTPWAVIGGTPIDSAFGSDALERRGIESKQYPLCDSSPQYEEVLAQPHVAVAEVKALVEQIARDGFSTIFAYCNSLTSVVDLKGLAADEGLRAVSPLDAYRAVFAKASDVSRVAVFAGNGPGVTGISAILEEVRPSVTVFGFALLSVVQDIESDLSAEVVISRNSLDLLGNFLEDQVDTVILGCTHFTVLEQRLAEVYRATVFDPTDKMIQLLINE